MYKKRIKRNEVMMTVGYGTFSRPFPNNNTVLNDSSLIVSSTIPLLGLSLYHTQNIEIYVQ